MPACGALDRGRSVVVPGVLNKLSAASGRFMPREWMTLLTARLLGAGKATNQRLLVDPALATAKISSNLPATRPAFS